jgi:hypothetical protein
MGERRSPFRIHLSLSAGERVDRGWRFHQPVRDGPTPAEGVRMHGQPPGYGPQASEGSLPTVPLCHMPQNPSRRHEKPPMDDRGECRGTYEGAANPCPQSLLLLPGEKVADGGGRMRGLFRQCVFGARRKSPHEEPPIDDTGGCRGTYEGARGCGRGS